MGRRFKEVDLLLKIRLCRLNQSGTPEHRLTVQVSSGLVILRKSKVARKRQEG